MPVEPLRVWAGDLGQVDIGDRSTRLGVNPIVRAHLDHRLGPDARAQRYGALLTDYELCPIDDAEIAVLPLAYERTDPHDLRGRVDAAERAGLRTMVFSTDDLEPIMPCDSLVLLHPGPTRGAQPRGRAVAIPYFFDDRAGGDLTRPTGPRPTVAFCGQGATRPAAAVVHLAQNLLRRTVPRRPSVVLPPVRGHIRVRARALRHLHGDSRVDDQFVIRKRYRAGATTELERARSQADFDANLRSAAYALCIRGQGNFSARFYEALSFGRIPLFVDTDCVLPFEDEIDWPQHCVRVGATEIDRIADILVEAHEGLGDRGDRSRVQLRELWEQRLTTDGFFRHLVPSVRAWT